MPIRPAAATDLPAIVAIYNASSPGRVATADTTAVTVESRRACLADFDRARRPRWVHGEGRVDAWLPSRSFYGRPAYGATVETGVYVDPAARRRGLGRERLDHAIREAPRLSIRTFLAFVFAHNAPSIGPFDAAGHKRWGLLPAVAELDGVERDRAILGLRVASPQQGPVRS